MCHHQASLNLNFLPECDPKTESLNFQKNKTEKDTKENKTHTHAHTKVD
jgi:hypothetical protein